MTASERLRQHLGKVYGRRDDLLLSALLQSWGQAIDRVHQDGEYAVAALDFERVAGRWLDLWGELFSVQRVSIKEKDPAYAFRVLAETIRLRPHNHALSDMLLDAFGIRSSVVDMWPYVLRGDQWTWPAGYPPQTGDSHLRADFASLLGPDSSVRGDIFAPFGPAVFGVWLHLDGSEPFDYSAETLRARFPLLLLGDGGENYWDGSHWSSACATTIASAGKINNGVWQGENSVSWDGNDDEIFLDLNLGDGIKRAYTGLKIWADTTYAATFDIRYSDDGILWYNAYTTWAPGATPYAELSWPSVGAHQYWRIYKTSLGDTGAWIQEVQFVTGSASLHVGDGHLTSPVLDGGPLDTARKGFGVRGDVTLVTADDVMDLINRHRAAGTQGVLMNLDLLANV